MFPKDKKATRIDVEALNVFQAKTSTGILKSTSTDSSFNLIFVAWEFLAYSEFRSRTTKLSSSQEWYLVVRLWEYDFSDVHKSLSTEQI